MTMVPMKPVPLALSDDQMDAVLLAAGPLDPDLRSDFLRDVAAALRGCELGDGAVARVCAGVQRRYLVPPNFSRSNDAIGLRQVK